MTRSEAGTDASSSAGAAATPTRVYLILGLGLISVSFSPILVRVAAEAPGMAIAVWRTVFAALIVVPFALVRSWRKRPPAFGRKTVAAIVTAAIFLALHFIMWIESLYHTSVASASVLVSTTPIFLAILGYFILRERLTLRIVAAIAVGVIGAVLIAGGDVGSAVSGNSTLGNGLALGASIAAAFYFMLGSVIRRGTDWLSYMAPLYLLVAVAVLLVAVVEGTQLLGHAPKFYVLCLAMAVGPQILGHGSFNFVLRYISPTLLSLLILLEPVVSSIVAYALFDEMPGGWAATGMLLVIGSVVIAVTGARERS